VTAHYDRYPSFYCIQLLANTVFKVKDSAKMTPTQTEILSLISGNSLTLSQLIEKTGKTKQNLANILRRLCSHGKVSKSDDGHYSTVPPMTDSDPHLVTDSNPSKRVTVTDSDLTSQLESEIEFLRDRVLFLEQQLVVVNKTLDQEQQLHAVSQKSIESQRLKLEEYQQPKPLIARLKAIFVAE